MAHSEEERLIFADDVAIKVCEVLGINPHRARRIVLDLPVGKPITAYVEMYGDTRFLNIKWELEGTKVEFSDVVSESVKK